MNITISLNEENNMLVIQEIMQMFSERFPDIIFKWSFDDEKMKTEVEASEEEIKSLFEVLINKYQDVDVEAIYVVGEKENNSNMVGHMRIYSIISDEHKTLKTDNENFWN